MKDLNLIVWLTHLGLSTALPLAGFVWLSVWLRSQFGLGKWIIVLGVIVGLCSAITGLWNNLKALERMGRPKKEKEDPPGVSFNDHD